jgi:hypothetical protein
MDMRLLGPARWTDLNKEKVSGQPQLPPIIEVYRALMRIATVRPRSKEVAAQERTERREVPTAPGAGNLSIG